MRLFIVVDVEGKGKVMAIKMRNNKDKDAVCCECGDAQDEVLNMFDLYVGGKTFTICDVCNKELFNKTLRAEVMKQGRVKSLHDMKIIRRRESREIGQVIKNGRL